MSGERDARVEISIKARLLDARRHLIALELAAAQFGGDFDVAALEHAWDSHEPEELTRAYAVQAGYENVINACIKIAQELVALRGWEADIAVERSSVHALRLLQENAVISSSARAALSDAQAERSAVQHDYVNVRARQIHAATLIVLEHAPRLLQSVADELRS